MSRRITRKAGFVSRDVERRRIEASFKLFDVPQAERAEILEAMLSDAERQSAADAAALKAAGRPADPVRHWDWFEDCDGCTCVTETYWPTKYFPPCLRHDFDWAVGNPVWQANARFYRLSRRYSMTRTRAALRFVGVTIGWYAFFKWKHMFASRRRATAAQLLLRALPAPLAFVDPAPPRTYPSTCADCGAHINPNEFPGVNRHGKWICTLCEEKQAEERMRREREGVT